VEPEGKSRVIKVDQTRDIVEFSGRTAGLGQRKVVVFSPAEALNISAANALLKCLEEPGAETFLLLVSHRPQGLLATIRSRCQQFRLSAPEREGALGWLDQQSGSRQSSERLYELASGQVLLAEQLLQDPELELLAALPQLLDALLSGQASSAEVGQQLAQLPVLELVLQLIQYLQSRLRQAGPERLAGPWGQAAFALLDDYGQQRAAIEAGANPNPQLFADSMLFRLVSQLASA
jgi:DNA polymerase-3 subunit delta'